MTTSMNIPFFGLARQSKNLREELLEATDEVLSSGQFLDGQFTNQLEMWIEKRIFQSDTSKFLVNPISQYVVLVHSGTQALEIIARFWKDRAPGHRPIVIPNITYPATFNAFETAGWDIEIADTDKNGLISGTNSVDISCVVGLYGAMPSIRGDTLIVDGAQHWLCAGPEDIAGGMAISFDPTKNLPATGNGGAIVTTHKNLVEFARDYRDNGKRSRHNIAGTNSKMGEIEAAHVLVRAKYIDEWQKRRREIREYYIDQLNDTPVRCLSKGFDTHADQKFVIYHPDRDEIHFHLRRYGIETRIHYPKTIAELPISVNVKKKPDMLGVSSMLVKGVLSLPIYPELDDGEVMMIAEKVRECFK